MSRRSKSSKHGAPTAAKGGCGKCTPCTMPELGLPCVELSKKKEKERKKKLRKQKLEQKRAAELAAELEEEQKNAEAAVHNRALRGQRAAKSSLSSEEQTRPSTGAGADAGKSQLAATAAKQTAARKHNTAPETLANADKLVKKSKKNSAAISDMQRQRNKIAASRDDLFAIMQGIDLDLGSLLAPAGSGSSGGGKAAGAATKNRPLKQTLSAVPDPLSDGLRRLCKNSLKGIKGSDNDVHAIVVKRAGPKKVYDATVFCGRAALATASHTKLSTVQRLVWYSACRESGVSVDEIHSMLQQLEAEKQQSTAAEMQLELVEWPRSAWDQIHVISTSSELRRLRVYFHERLRQTAGLPGSAAREVISVSFWPSAPASTGCAPLDKELEQRYSGPQVVGIALSSSEVVLIQLPQQGVYHHHLYLGNQSRGKKQKGGAGNLPLDLPTDSFSSNFARIRDSEWEVAAIKCEYVTTSNCSVAIVTCTNTPLW